MFCFKLVCSPTPRAPGVQATVNAQRDPRTSSKPADPRLGDPRRSRDPRTGGTNVAADQSVPVDTLGGVSGVTKTPLLPDPPMPPAGFEQPGLPQKAETFQIADDPETERGSPQLPDSEINIDGSISRQNSVGRRVPYIVREVLVVKDGDLPTHVDVNDSRYKDDPRVLKKLGKLSLKDIRPLHMQRQSSGDSSSRLTQRKDSSDGEQKLQVRTSMPGTPSIQSPGASTDSQKSFDPRTALSKSVTMSPSSRGPEFCPEPGPVIRRTFSEPAETDLPLSDRPPLPARSPPKPMPAPAMPEALLKKPSDAKAIFRRPSVEGSGEKKEKGSSLDYRNDPRFRKKKAGHSPVHAGSTGNIAPIIGKSNDNSTAGSDVDTASTTPPTTTTNTAIDAAIERTLKILESDEEDGSKGSSTTSESKSSQPWQSITTTDSKNSQPWHGSMDYSSPLNIGNDSEPAPGYSAYNRPPNDQYEKQTDPRQKRNSGPKIEPTASGVSLAASQPGTDSQQSIFPLTTESLAMPPPTTNASGVASDEPSLRDVFKTIDPTASPFC